jgi:hypothetical protein
LIYKISYLQEEKNMAVVQELLRVESDGTLSFGDYTLDSKTKLDGFEFQGDSLYLARRELLMSYMDYYYARWNREPDRPMLKNIAEIISWNLWQMDGFSYRIPTQDGTKSQLCKIKEWDLRYRCEGGEIVLFKEQIRPNNTKRR